MKFVTCDQFEDALSNINVGDATDTQKGVVSLNLGLNPDADATNCTEALTACGLLAILQDQDANNAIINAIKSLGSANRFPVQTQSLAFDITSGVAISKNANDYFSDPDGDVMTFTATGLPTGIVLSSAGLLTGSTTVVGQYPITITANDGKGGITTGSGTWSVIAATANTPPVQSNSLNFDFTTGVAVNKNANDYFTDPNGDTLTFTATGIPAGLLFSSAGVLSGMATTVGQYNVSITANDGRGGTVTGTGVWNVIAATVNLPPTSTLPSTFGPNPVGTQFNIDVDALYFSDPDGDNLTYTSLGLPSGLTLSSQGVLTGTVSGSASTYNFSITANDGKGGTITKTATWQITAANNPPVQSNSLAFDITAGVNANKNANDYFTDPDGDALTFTATGIPPGLTFSSAGLLTGVTTAVGQYNVSITANDGKGGTVTGNGVWNVISQSNQAPTTTLPSTFGPTNLGDAYSTDVEQFFSDPDGDTLTFTGSGFPPGIALSAGGMLTGTTTATGTYTFSITANDGKGGTVTGTATWTVV